jgi:hypothetical protein
MAQLQRIPVDLIHLVVVGGLDRRAHHGRKIYAKRMDPWVTAEDRRAPNQTDWEPQAVLD